MKVEKGPTRHTKSAGAATKCWVYISGQSIRSRVDGYAARVDRAGEAKVQGRLNSKF